MAKTKSKMRHRYREGKGLIEIRIRQSRQLFDLLDPSPYVDKDLNADTIEYLEGSAEEFSSNEDFCIVIHLSEEDPSQAITKEEIRSAIRSFFEYQAEGASRRIKASFRRGRVALTLGAVILAACLSSAHFLRQISGPNLIGGLISEGLVIVGWVALWKPVEIILYDWWPLFERRSLFERLSRAQVDVINDHPVGAL